MKGLHDIATRRELTDQESRNLQWYLQSRPETRIRVTPDGIYYWVDYYTDKWQHWTNADTDSYTGSGGPPLTPENYARIEWE